jgi:hypothetical protein
MATLEPTHQNGGPPQSSPGGQLGLADPGIKFTGAAYSGHHRPGKSRLGAALETPRWPSATEVREATPVPVFSVLRVVRQQPAALSHGVDLTVRATALPLPCVQKERRPGVVPKHCPRARQTHGLYPGRKTDGRDVLGRAAPAPAGAICSSGVARARRRRHRPPGSAHRGP